jgi:alpha-methylacyl-CoA racemase
MTAGPLADVTVVELGGMGPAPFATMLMADLGADVIRVDRPGRSGLFPGEPRQALLNRNKRSIALDLKQPGAVEVVRALTAGAEVLVEGYRPGVAERLGLGPDDLRAANERLVYCRMTGWGQTGPLAQRAGHDIDYIAITGALHVIGEAGGPPQIPANLLGDFAAGGAYLVIGALAALREADRTGVGQVVDAAIVDGSAHLLTALHAMLGAGGWVDERGANMLDGAAPFYRVYETADGKFMAAGAIEPQFYAELVAGLGVDVDLSAQQDRSIWDHTAERFAKAFSAHDQAHWVRVFADSDACVAPVVSMREAAAHPHLVARGSLVERDGVLQSAPAPRFSRAPGVLRTPPPLPGEHTLEVLSTLGIDPDPLLASGAAVQTGP